MRITMDFSPWMKYKLYLLIHQFKKAFDKYKIYVQYPDLILVVDKFDKNKDGKISISEVK